MKQILTVLFSLLFISSSYAHVCQKQCDKTLTSSSHLTPRDSQQDSKKDCHRHKPSKESSKDKESSKCCPLKACTKLTSLDFSLTEISLFSQKSFEKFVPFLQNQDRRVPTYEKRPPLFSSLNGLSSQKTRLHLLLQTLLN